MYDFKKASDLAKWAEEQYKRPNYYKNSGIGRYDGQYRQFDCCGLFKCFMWHDYSQKNAKYYNVTQKDYNCEQLIAEAKEKGSISAIPEIPGVLVYMKGHMGIYIGNGQVIESTAAKFDGKKGRIYRTYFKGNGKGCDGKRATWTKWFKSPYLKYETKPVAPAKPTTSFFPAKGYFGYGDTHVNVGKIASFMYKTFPAYTNKRALGNWYGPKIKASITEFQKRTGLEPDGCVGPLTLKKLIEYGFRH